MISNREEMRRLMRSWSCLVQERQARFGVVTLLTRHKLEPSMSPRSLDIQVQEASGFSSIDNY